MKYVVIIKCVCGIFQKMLPARQNQQLLWQSRIYQPPVSLLHQLNVHQLLPAPLSNRLLLPPFIHQFFRRRRRSERARTRRFWLVWLSVSEALYWSLLLSSSFLLSSEFAGPCVTFRNLYLPKTRYIRRSNDRQKWQMCTVWELQTDRTIILSWILFS